MPKFDFSGYATKNDLRCSDGRTIRRNAFAHQDGMKVPLAWSHQHTSPENIVGHAVLENRDDGVYAYGTFNETPTGEIAKQLVQHGDIVAMSIYANQLQQRGNDVIHGSIKEVSLVMAGANPGALIDNVVIQHSDGATQELNDEAYIFCGEEFDDVARPGYELQHEDKEDSGETVQDVWDTLSEKQKNVVYALVGEALSGESDDEEAEHSDEEGITLKHNVFDQYGKGSQESHNTLSHSEISAIITDARDKKMDSLKDAFLAHEATADMPNGIPGEDYGIANLDVLLPDFKAVRDQPDLVARDDAWVQSVIGGASKSPFSRIKMLWFDITADIARARGYRKGHLKKEEVVKMAQRKVEPTTIYKKQRLDRDDIIDISNFNIVAWLKAEMQRMLREEVARAILIGDGRPVMKADGTANEDKIDETRLRPILTEDELYAYTAEIDLSADDRNVRYKNAINDIKLAMMDYKGSGSPTFFTTKKTHLMMQMVEDAIDHKLYPTDRELTAALGVNNIVEVPVMEDYVDEDGRELIGIIVNMRDYTIGMNNGGQTQFFDDFDIDFNQYKYLYETRMSGALTRMDSAVILKTAKMPPLHSHVEGATDTDNFNMGEMKASDIQSKVAVSTTGNISGVLKYVDEWTEYSGNKDEQSGHYLALKIENDGSDDSAEVHARLVNSTNRTPFKKLSGDKLFITRVTDEMGQKIAVKLVGTNGKVETRTYSLSGLTLEKE